jgi:hypothetical protein
VDRKIRDKIAELRSQEDRLLDGRQGVEAG